MRVEHLVWDRSAGVLDQSISVCETVRALSLQKNLALLAVELHESPLGPFLQPVEHSLDGSMTFWSISHSSQFGVDCNLSKGTLCPIIQIIDEVVKQDWSQRYRPPVYCTSLIGLQIDFVPQITTLWAWPFIQFSIQLPLCSSSPYFISFSMRILQETTQKALLKSG